MKFTHRTDEYDYVEYPVTERAMCPCYKPGQSLMVSNAPLRPGSGVFITLKDGRVLVRELVEVAAQGATVRSYWPKEKTALIPRSEIVELLCIVGVMDADRTASAPRAPQASKLT